MSVQFPDHESLSDRNKGLVLAVSSSIFIGASFIVKKKGLRAAGATGIRAGSTPDRTVVTLVTIDRAECTSPTMQAVAGILTCPSHYGGQAW